MTSCGTVLTNISLSASGPPKAVGTSAAGNLPEWHSNGGLFHVIESDVIPCTIECSLVAYGLLGLTVNPQVPGSSPGRGAKRHVVGNQALTRNRSAFFSLIDSEKDSKTDLRRQSAGMKESGPSAFTTILGGEGNHRVVRHMLASGVSRNAYPHRYCRPFAYTGGS